MNHVLPNLQDIEAAAQVVYREFAATPQYRWATLSERLGTDCWVKHENHTPVGAFKIRGGLTYFDRLKARGELPREVISATRGNHGQSIGWAARAHGVACTIVVPRGNSVEKNAAMRALGATLYKVLIDGVETHAPWGDYRWSAALNRFDYVPITPNAGGFYPVRSAGELWYNAWLGLVPLLLTGLGQVFWRDIQSELEPVLQLNESVVQEQDS